MADEELEEFYRGCYVIPPDKAHLHEPAGECPFRSELRPRDRKWHVNKLSGLEKTKKQCLQDEG